MANGSVLRGRTVWVSGAGGFFGTAIVQALLAEGATVRAMLGAPDGSHAMSSDVAAARIDIGATDELAEHIADAELVVHLAGPPSVAESFQQPRRFAHAHLVGTASVLEACHRRSVRRLVYVSSAEVYGRPARNPVHEDDALQPRSPYGIAKMAAERFVRLLAPELGMPAVILRPFSLYGPGQSERSLLATILRQAVSGADEIRLADLEPVRDYCFVGDAAMAVVRAAATTINDVATFNIGSGKGTSVRQLAQEVLAACGRDVPVVAGAGDRPAHAGPSTLIADPTRARQRLGWQASTTLREGLTAMITGEPRREAM